MRAPTRSISADQGNLRAEAYRQVRTNLQFIDVERSVKSVVITSAIPDEGKSTTACNLAIAFARTGARVLLVEADLRRPRTADYLGIEGAVGLTNVLLGQVPVGDVLQTWGTLPLKVLPSGPIPPNPSELLGSTPMIELVHLLGSHADIVILDAPPLLPVTDAAVLSTVCDGALIVARHGHTRRDQLLAADEAVTKVGGRVLGVLLNRVPRRGAGKGYGYEYGYGYYTSAEANRPTDQRERHTDHHGQRPPGQALAKQARQPVGDLGHLGDHHPVRLSRPLDRVRDVVLLRRLPGSVPRSVLVCSWSSSSRSAGLSGHAPPATRSG